MSSDLVPNSLFGSNDTDYSVTIDEIAAFKIRIQNAFSLFDLSGRNVINKRDIGTVIRYLGYFPSEQDIKQFILPQLNEFIENYKINTNLNNNEDTETSVTGNDNKSDANANEIEYSMFELLMIQIMKRNLYPSDDEDTILSAFQVIQKQFNQHHEQDEATVKENEEKRIVYKNDIISAFKHFGDEYCLNERELDEFLNIASITTNKKNKNINQNDEQDQDVIHYEDYVDELFFQLTSHA